MFVCALRLYPGPAGWGVRCGCVCLGSGLRCAPPLLAGVLASVCVCVGAPLVPRHSWLGCAMWVCLLGLGFRLRPATPGCGVGVCVSLCSRSACTSPILAGVRAVGVFAWAPVSTAPCHSWLGYWGVCVFVCALRLYPATPAWGVRCGRVCWGFAFGCAPPLLAGVLGCVCVFACALPLYPATPGWGVQCCCVCLGFSLGWAPPLLAGVLGCVCVCLRAPLVPRHSWLGRVVCVCVFGLGFGLRPATPGRGVRVGVCWRARSACTLPLLAGVCGVGVCAWSRVLAVPRNSWLGCSGVCVFVCALRLYPATPCWGLRCVCVCLGSGFGCAPPLLAGGLASLCVCVRAPLVGQYSRLGCALWVCLLGLKLQLCPATPGWGVGVCMCLCGRSARTPPLLAGVCGVGVCAWARASVAPRHSWRGCWGLCVFVCLLPLYPGTPGWDVRCGCVCLGSGFDCALPLLAGVLGCVCLCVRASIVPHHSWLGCAVWVCVLGLWSGQRPATPGWGVGVCVCWCARSPCTPPLLAGVYGVGVCAWAQASAAHRHSWLGCWGLCVFVCALRLYPATPGWAAWCGCVRLGSGFGSAPPLLAGVLGSVCVCVCAPLVPRHSWLRCAVWVCVLGLGFWLRPATPGWGVGVCVCLCACSACTPPLLAGVLGCLFVCVRAPLVPRHSWLGCAVWVCLLALGFRLRPATPGWGVGVCVSLCARFASTSPLLAGVCGVGVCAGALVSAAPSHSWLGCWGVRVFVCALPLYPATPGCGVRCGCVCLGSGFGCAPPLLARVLGSVCVCVRAPRVPRHPWLRCVVWVCVLGLGSRLRRATPSWVVGVCVSLCACFACTPPLLAGVCGVCPCVLGLGFRLRFGIGVCVCWCARSACIPPLLAGV